MDIVTEIRDLLLAMPAVTNQVGSGSSARIWGGWPRTYAVPCVVIEVDSEDLQNGLDGNSIGNVAQIAVTCRGGTAAEARALREAVKALQGHAGTLDVVFDSVVHSQTPKGDGSTAHWYDEVFDGVAIFAEAMP